MLKHHKHLILRAQISNPPKSADELNNWCIDTIKAVGMNVLMGPFTVYSNVPNNEGYTCLGALDFSHIAIHFWDKSEVPFFEFDLFSCKDFDVNIPYEKLQQFGIEKLAAHYINRDLMAGFNDANPFDKLFTVYKTTNKLTGEYYYGKHGFIKMDDGYLGSGIVLRQAIKKYGRSNFKCEHLRLFNTEHAAFEFEKMIINDDVLADSMCYNLAYGGQGSPKTLETRKKLSKSKMGSPGTTNGRKFYNNGVEEKLFIPTTEPIDWRPGRLQYSKRGLRNVRIKGFN